MSRKRVLMAGGLLLVVLLNGCSSVGNYAGNRGADLADLFILEGSVGPGLDAHAQVTGLLGTGIGSSKQWGLMWHGRYLGMGSRDSGGLILSAHTYVEEDLMPPVRGDSEYEPRSRSWFLLLRWPPFRPLLKPAERCRALDLELGLSALVGFHVGFSPIQTLDFLLGWTTLDLCGDDYTPHADTEPSAPETNQTPPLLQRDRGR